MTAWRRKSPTLLREGGEIWRKSEKDGEACESRTISVAQRSKRTFLTLITIIYCKGLKLEVAEIKKRRRRVPCFAMCSALMLEQSRAGRRRYQKQLLFIVQLLKMVIKLMGGAPIVLLTSDQFDKVDIDLSPKHHLNITMLLMPRCLSGDLKCPGKLFNKQSAHVRVQKFVEATSLSSFLGNYNMVLVHHF